MIPVDWSPVDENRHKPREKSEDKFVEPIHACYQVFHQGVCKHLARAVPSLLIASKSLTRLPQSRESGSITAFAMAGEIWQEPLVPDIHRANRLYNPYI